MQNTKPTAVYVLCMSRHYLLRFPVAYHSDTQSKRKLANFKPKSTSAISESDENSDTETEFSKNFPDGDPFDEQPSTSSSNPAATTCSIEVLCENFGKKTVTMAKDRKTEAAGLVFYNLLATLPQNMARLIGHCSEQIIDIMFEVFPVVSFFHGGGGGSVLKHKALLAFWRSTCQRN